MMNDIAAMRDGKPSQTAWRAVAYRAVHQTEEGGDFKDQFALRILARRGDGGYLE
jgi:hypothetical protein